MADEASGPDDAGHLPVTIGVLGLAPQSASITETGLLVRRIPFPRILQNHSITRQTGILAIERDNLVRSIHFVAGDVVWAESGEHDERFSDWLVRNEIFPQASVRGAGSLVRSGVCRFGEALLRQPSIDPGKLAVSAERYVLEVTASAFEWRRGSFKFHAAPSRSFESPVRLEKPIGVHKLVFEGFRRMSDVGLAAAWLGDLSSPRSFTADPIRYLTAETFSPAHVELLARFSVGCFSVAEVMHAGILSPEEVLRFLGAFDALGDLTTV